MNILTKFQLNQLQCCATVASFTVSVVPWSQTRVGVKPIDRNQARAHAHWLIVCRLMYPPPHSAYSESFSWVARPIGEPVGPSWNFVCGFCGGTGTNYEGCEQNFDAAQVIMRKGVSKGTNTSFCHPLSVSEPSCATKPYYCFLMGLYGAL